MKIIGIEFAITIDITNEGSEECIVSNLNVIEISKLATKNGPGFRTMVHFKGCPLRCFWCSTPESQSEKPQIMFDKAKCIQCGKCIKNCGKDAITLQNGELILNREKCSNCFDCVSVCHTNALTIAGKYYSPEALAEIILRDKVFFKNSNGGVTFSGGEPLYHLNDSMLDLFKILKSNEISIGIDTTGYVPFENLIKVFPFVDFFLWDLKHINPLKHKEYTGVDNATILDNLKKVADFGIDIYLRCPIIPGCNDDVEHIEGICKVAKQLKSLKEVHIIPVHHYGINRYVNLGQEYPLDSDLKLDITTINFIKEVLERNQLAYKIIF